MHVDRRRYLALICLAVWALVALGCTGPRLLGLS